MRKSILIILLLALITTVATIYNVITGGFSLEYFDSNEWQTVRFVRGGSGLVAFLIFPGDSKELSNH